MSASLHPLSAEQISFYLQDSLKSWTLQENALQRIVSCPAYLQSLEVLYEIGKMAESDHHHPDLLLHYKRLTIRYWTHTVNGISALDVQAALKVDSLLEKLNL